MNEFSFIEYLKKRIPRTRSGYIGIGDDAAALDVAKDKQLVVSTDVIVENIDFRMGDLSPEQIGRKALAVNLSDVAAMGATPKAFVIGIGKPRSISTKWLKRFYSGLLKLAKRYGVICIGGDFSRSKEFFASVTIFGEVSPHHLVRRSGAKLGDWIGVTGTLGGSRLRHHFDFTPRIREGLFLGSRIKPTAMIDISDGLIQDLGHILKSSKVGAVLELDKIPVSQDSKKLSGGNKEKSVLKALSDGEDFELLFTVSPRKKMVLERQWKKQFPKVSLTWIGRIQGAKPAIRWMRHGKPIPAPKLSQKGFSHF